MFVSSFYNSKTKKSETFISPHPGFTREMVKGYIDKYIPVEFRVVNGVDSLNIVKIDAELIIRSPGGFKALPHE